MLTRAAFQRSTCGSRRAPCFASRQELGKMQGPVLQYQELPVEVEARLETRIGGLRFAKNRLEVPHIFNDRSESLRMARMMTMMPLVVVTIIRVMLPRITIRLSTYRDEKVVVVAGITCDSRKNVSQTDDRNQIYSCDTSHDSAELE